MTTVLLYPLGLAALAAALLPVLLHLARRRMHRRLPFAAMRWLPPGRAPRRSLRIEEPGLLALRVLLLTLAALWLAQPVLRGWGGSQRWIAVAPEVDPAHARQAGAGFDRAVWLAPGFPRLSDPAPASGVLASLLRELDARVPEADRVEVLLADRVDGLDARALRLGRDVTWHTGPAARSIPADREAGDRETLDPPLVALRYEDAQAPAMRWLRAAADAWSANAGRKVRVDEAAAGDALPADALAIIWVGEAPGEAARARARDGAMLLQLGGPGEGTTVDAAAAPLPVLRVRDGPDAWLRMPDPLQPAQYPQLLDPGFPHMLREILLGAPAPPRLAHADAFIEGVTKTPRHAMPSGGLRDLDLQAPLAVLIALLFALERALATGRRLGRPR